MLSQLKSAVLAVIVMTLLTGVGYPLVVTGIAQVAFPRQANGSLVHRGDVAVGSTLIGQPFGGAGYFWSRPSATGPFPYNGAASSGSNLAPTSPELVVSVRARVAALRASDARNPLPVPVDLVTASGSGLDPHVSPASALYQASRVARARGLSEAQVRALVAAHTAGRQLGFLGEPAVNVLELNLALDAAAPLAAAGR